MEPPLVDIITDTEFTCPFCGAECAASKEECLVVHPVPMCAAYASSKDALDFVQMVNRELRRLADAAK